jgi:hypothetical protein
MLAKQIAVDVKTVLPALEGIVKRRHVKPLQLIF